MKSVRFLRLLSLALALLSVAALVYVDNEIATTYSQSDGKTQALFGLIEFSRFRYKYLILIPAMLSIALTVKVFGARKFSLFDMGSLVIALTAIIGTVTSSWRLLV
jgi:hypothetical protein